MKVNLALHILSFVIYSMSQHAVGEVALSEYRKQSGIPAPTFYRHVKSLRDQGFLMKVGRDRYKLNIFFASRMCEIVDQKRARVNIVNLKTFDDIPF